MTVKIVAEDEESQKDIIKEEEVISFNYNLNIFRKIS